MKKKKVAFFTAKRSALLKVLKQLRIHVVNPKRNRYKTICEITIVTGRVIFNVPGATFAIEVKTEGAAKATVELETLWMMINTYRGQIRIAIEKYTLTLNEFSMRADTSFLEDDSILRSIMLPLNYSELDLVAIAKSNKYTMEELEFNDLWVLTNQAETRLTRNLHKAAEALKPYGITLDDIKKIVGKGIKVAIDSVVASLELNRKLNEGDREIRG